MSPTQRTLAHFRAQGHSVAITEHWNQWAKRRQDLFGMIDIIVLRNTRVLGVQCTSSTNHSARVKKVMANEHALNWVKCADLMVVSWKKRAREPRITLIYCDETGDRIFKTDI